jgi:hypothetical protein
VSHALIRVTLVLVLTPLLLCQLLVWDPFRHLIHVFNRPDPVHEDAKVSYFTDPNTQEISIGEHPLAGLRQLESHWCQFNKETRYIITGNSQTFTVQLAPSERHSSQVDRTYPDLLLDRLKSLHRDMQGYRLSAPNISYMEVLWYLDYLVLHPCLVPSEFVLQLNFETFRKLGVRDGMLELLQDPEFASAIEREANSPAPYSGTFQKALDQYRSQRATQVGNEAGASSISKTGLTEARGVGPIIETVVRAGLEKLSSFRAREKIKSELLLLLYQARVYLLGITPTSKRSLGGSTLTANVSSLERIGELCKNFNIKLVFFNAPQNPNAPLYRTASDGEQYRQIVTQLIRDKAQSYYDFEDSIPGPMWGNYLGGVDPIHFGRAAHQRLADLMFERGMIGDKR